MQLLKLQQQFKDVLLQTGRASLLPLLGSPEHQEAALFVYRNNLYEGLYKNLTHKFSMTQRWLGEEAFFSYAKEYIFNFPQSSPYLCEYGEYFPQTLDDDVGKELATLEWKMNAALLSYEAPIVLQIEDLLTIPPPLMGGVSFRLHSSVQLSTSSYALRELWMALKENKTVSAYKRPSYFCIAAENMKSTFFVLTEEEYEFMVLIKEGRSLGEVYDFINNENSFQELLSKFIPYFKEIINKSF